MPGQERHDLSTQEEKAVSERAAPRSPVIYQVVRRQGEEELARPVGSLAMSGLAAGLAIMASVIAQGALREKLPESVAWRDLASDLGYSLGFLIVILGRLQLFTEQTIVSVLPVVAAPDWRKLGMAARLWAVVFAANMAGAALAAVMNLHLGLVSPELGAAMLEVSARLLEKAPLDLMLQGIPAGFLIASVAWLRAGASGSEFLIVLALSTAIALGDFTHVVAGAAETFLLVADGRIGLGHAGAGIILPALVGNVIGGTGLFALLAHGQVRQEI